MDPMRYGFFGCAVAGLHTDTSEERECVRCTLSPENSAESTPFDDDRGSPPQWSHRTQDESWPHRRWLDSHGRLHREGDEPALVSNGWQVWAVHGRIYRPAGGPAIVAGDNWAHTNAAGYLHRIDAPALCWNREVNYIRDGVLTRADGAAVIYRDLYAEYHLDGRRLASRDELWKRWLQPHGVALDNVEAQKHLHEVLGASDEVTAAFPEPDALTVQLALRLSPSL